MAKNREFIPVPKGTKFYPRYESQYPSVTSIISAINPIEFPEEKLKQYAARGSIRDAQIEHFFHTGNWQDDVLKIPQTEEAMFEMCNNLNTLENGSLHLDLQACNFLGFWEKYGKNFTPWEGYQYNGAIVFNDRFRYAGRPDHPCLYQGEPAIVDYKTSSYYPRSKVIRFFKQTAGYARAGFDGVKKLVIVPLNPKNKYGFGEPIIETNIEKYFNYFLDDRYMFKEIFGY
jgi:hypothetical protein